MGGIKGFGIGRKRSRGKGAGRPRLSVLGTGLSSLCTRGGGEVLSQCVQSIPGELGSEHSS